MKPSVWNTIAVAFLIGTVFLVILFGLSFAMPDQMLPANLRPVTVPEKVILPTITETAFQFPPTWTTSPKPVTPSETPLTPTRTLTQGSSTASAYVLPSHTETPSLSPTYTRTNTSTYSASKVVLINGTAATFTKTKKPTKTKTPTNTITPGGNPAFGAVEDVASVAPYPASVLINVLANDFNDTGTPIRIVSIPKGPYHGNLQVLNDNATIQYWPDQGFMGVDSFYYKMTNTGGLTDFAWCYIYVMDGSNDIPTDIQPHTLTVLENQPAGTVVGTFTTEDAGPTPYYYSLVSGDGSSGNGAFQLSSDGILVTKANFNREAQSVYSIRVRSVDGGGLYVEKIITILIGDVNERPTITSSNSGTATVGTPSSFTFSAIDNDPGDAVTFSYDPVPGIPPGFTFTPNANNTATLTGTPAQPGTYTISLIATDLGGLTDTQTFTLTVNAP